MKYLLGAVVLVAVSLFLAGSTADTHAQGKKPAKGTIELIKSRDGKYRFNVRDAEGKYLGGSTVAHATEKEAKEAAEELKSVMATATYVSKTAEDAEKPKDK
jgi:hypothetical protein